jgi:hypothetical protein
MASFRDPAPTNQPGQSGGPGDAPPPRELLVLTIPPVWSSAIAHRSLNGSRTNG